MSSLPDALALSDRFSAGVLDNTVWALDRHAGRSVQLGSLPFKKHFRTKLLLQEGSGVLFLSPRSQCCQPDPK